MIEQAKDIIIIGAGPTGLVCGMEAQKAGLSYLILEKGLLVNSIYNFPTNMTFFSTSKNLEIGNIPFISHTEKPTRREALEYYRRFALSNELKIHYGTEVLGVSKGDCQFVINTNRKVYTAKYVILATGFYDQPRMLNVPGENLSKVKHYYEDAHPYVGRKLLIVGAKNSACDVALETWRQGAEVTMAVRGSDIHDRVKYWILPNIKNRIKEGSIKAYFNTEVESITEDHVVLNTPTGSLSLENDFVLAMTGYQPDFDFFRKIGLDLEGEELRPKTNKHLESSIANLYLAGVIISGLKTNALFIENTRDHGQRIIKDIIAKSVL